MCPTDQHQHALEVQLALDVKQCRECQWFWGGIPPYGPYPSFDWTRKFPAIFREEKQQTMGRKATPLMEAPCTGYNLVDPAIMHGCRKAPIMTIGINPNLTSYFKGKNNAAWAYPCFSDPANYAYYYRFQTIYQESVEQEIIAGNLIPGTELVAEHDGWLLDVQRGSDHRWLELVIQYECELDIRFVELAWDIDARYVVRVNRVRKQFTIGRTFSFKKGEVIAAKLAYPDNRDGLLYENPTRYYQQFIPMLRGLSDYINKTDSGQKVDLSIGEDVAQHDMIGCASPGWSESYDIPIETITRKCVGKKGFAQLQVLQSKPEILVIVGKSSMKMFGEYFGPYLDLDYRGKDIYQLLKETCSRKKYLSINLGEYSLKSRLIVCPHFSYSSNYFAQSRLSEEAWIAFQKDFPDDVEFLRGLDGVLSENGYNGVTAIKIEGRKDAIQKDVSAAAWSVMMAYHYDPVKMIADVLIEEFEQGNLGINSTGKHLKRSAGPCNFCHNELWNFETDQGCMYGVDTKQYTNGYLEDLAKKYFTGGIC
jgi:hypothetical protein